MTREEHAFIDNPVGIIQTLFSIGEHKKCLCHSLYLQSHTKLLHKIDNLLNGEQLNIALNLWMIYVHIFC